MSEQRIDTAAEAATSTDADPGEGLGLSGAGAHTDPLNPRGTAGGDAEMPQPAADREGGTAGDTGGTTEGEAHLRATRARQDSPSDLSGRSPAGSGGGSGAGSAGGSGGGSGAGGDRRDGVAETGEVSAAPSQDRRAEDPGSVATEFGDRADTAPDDGPEGDIAHPTI